jgi:hypothetical protein
MQYYDEEKKEEPQSTSQPAAPAQKAANLVVSPSQQPAWTQAMGDHPPASLQTKLTVNQPGDAYEREADQVADQVIHMPTSGTSTTQEASLVMRKESGGAQSTQSAPPIVNQALSSGSQPLDAGTQATMQSRFGHDFSDVRVHTDEQAAESAQAVNARAYTVGKDMVFGSGEYAPGTSEGQKLIAHELTHVVQGREGGLQGATTAVLRRQLKYHEQVEPEKAQTFLAAFDRSVETIATEIGEAKGLKGPASKDLHAALEQLRALRKRNKVTVWYTSGGLHYASYDNASGELRLHIYFPKKTVLPTTLVHEAIHAVHAQRYPHLSQMYGELLKAGEKGTTDESKGVLALQWKVWTEYWAYRRAAEFDDLRQEPKNRRNPEEIHQDVMKEKGVKEAIAYLHDQTGKEIDPRQWKPPAKVPDKRRPHEEESTH